MKTVVGRFAPTPSGKMHLGNVLCCLVAWLSARSQGGKVLLRVEDLDPERSGADYERQIEEDLRWLGLDWDEGGLEAAGGRYCQSGRSGVYEQYFDILKRENLVYPCFCSRAELHAADAPHLSDGRYFYPGTCRNLTPEEAAEKAKKRKPAWRVKVPDETVRFTDLHYGPYAENLAAECGDFVIRRADGVFAYQLATAVDDGLMGGDRGGAGPGSDRLDRPAALAPADAGASKPGVWAYPAADRLGRSRLSKRDGDLDLARLREKWRPGGNSRDAGGGGGDSAGIPAGERPGAGPAFFVGEGEKEGCAAAGRVWSMMRACGRVMRRRRRDVGPAGL